MTQGAFPSYIQESAPELQSIERRKRLADALQAQAMAPVDAGQAGGMVAPISWTQGLAKAMQAYAGKKQGEKADEEAKALRTQSDERRNADVGMLVAALKGREATPGGLTEDASGNVTRADPLPAQSPYEGLQKALPMMRDPGMQQAAFSTMLSQMPKKPEAYTLKKDEVRYDPQGRPISFGLPTPDKPTDFSLAPGHTRYDANNKPIVTAPAAPEKPLEQQPLSLATIVDPKDPTRMLQIDARRYKGGTLGSPGVIGVSGKEPTTAKREEQLSGGKEQVDSLVTQLRDAYTQLQEGGGITDPSKGFMSNVKAGIASSGIGQGVGRIAGTQNQSTRNFIAQSRPLLLNAIKNATGMSAKQMDSNAEMKLYLAAATDPQLDIKANMAALDSLEKLFGSGGGAAGAPKPGKPTPPKPAELPPTNNRDGN